MYRNRIWSFGDAGERTQRNRILPLSGPGAFTPVAAPLTTTSTRITWNAPKGTIDSYRLERSLDKTTWSTVSSGLTTLTADDTGRTESTLYYYRVISVVGGLDKETSDMTETWTIPSTPTGLTATAISASQINLAWTDVSTGNTAQIVERRNPPTTGTYAVIATVGATATAYNDETVSSGVTYEYRVAATNPATQSAYSTAATATAGSVPTTPVVTVGTITKNSIALSWTSTGADTYTVEWSADGGSTWASVGEYTTNTATSVTDGSLLSNTGYDYRVRATNTNGNSGYGTASGTTLADTYDVTYLTVGGGGGGGGSANYSSGGGGAGGYRTAGGFSLTSGTSYTITVGGGGAAGNGTAASSGSDSVFSTITSTGGGAGGSLLPNSPFTVYSPATGGSGGGGGAQILTSPNRTTNGATGTSGQGNAGGNGRGSDTSADEQCAGGGGGAGGAGSNGSSTNGGAGGAASSSSISGSSVSYSGGGGGGKRTATGGSGGTGGTNAGNGGTDSAGGAGTANRGGGGGGGGNAAGGNGGSGLVILRMATANYSGTTTGSPTVTTSGSDTILTFNASGSYTA